MQYLNLPIVVLVHLFSTLTSSALSPELLLQRYVYDGTFFNKTHMLATGMENEENPESNRYSIIGTNCSALDKYKGSDDKYLFKIVWHQEASKTYEVVWKQSSCLQSDTITGYEAMSVPFQKNAAWHSAFIGLGRDDTREKSFLDGNGADTTHASNRIAPFQGWLTSYPGFNSELALSNELYILAPDTFVSCHHIWNTVDKKSSLIGTTDIYRLYIDHSSYDVRCSFIYLGNNKIFIGALFESFANVQSLVNKTLYPWNITVDYNEYNLSNYEDNPSTEVYRWSRNNTVHYSSKIMDPMLLTSCNYAIDINGDHILLPFTFDVFQSECFDAESISVRGYWCSGSDTMSLSLSNVFGWHFNSSTSSCCSSTTCGCPWNNGSVASEDNFGHYSNINPQFSCTSSSTTTTDHYIGTIENIIVNYRFVAQSLIVSEAEQECQNLYGTSLASIHSIQDQKDVTDLCVQAIWRCYLGGYRELPDSENCDYVWDDGTSYDYIPTFDVTSESPEGCQDGQPRLCGVVHAAALYSCTGGDNEEVYFICNAPICIENPLCLTVTNGSTDWTYSGGASYHSQNGPRSIHSGNAGETNTVTLNQCIIFTANSSKITSIGFNFQFAYGFSVDNGNYSELEVELKSKLDGTVCTTWRTQIYDKDDEAIWCPYVKCFTSMVHHTIPVDPLCVLQGDFEYFEYEINLIFINNDNSFYLYLDTMSLLLNYMDEAQNGDIMTFDFDKINVNQYITDNITYLKANESITFVGEAKTCPANADCLIQCDDKASCVVAKMTANNNGYATRIFCNGLFACFGVEILSTANDISMDIVCLEENACSELLVDVKMFKSFNLYCIGSRSCSAATVVLDPTFDSSDDGVIECVSETSCDDLRIITTSEYTQLMMYKYSENIVFDNGIGYLSEIDNILCNDNLMVSISVSTDTVFTETFVSDLILEQYGTDFPCNGIEVKCSNATAADTLSACSMEYYIKDTALSELNSSPVSDGCYKRNVQDLQHIICAGNCDSSPTSNPTYHPTTAPTKVTLNPTYDPTIEPTQQTHDPTVYPTLVPTIKNPTAFPTKTPTIDPTSYPTVNPTENPTSDPTKEPTTNPTAAPSNAPTTPPTNAPNTSPTNAPTQSPSQTPSFPPTSSPSNIPTNPPSAAPTRVPTINIDDAYDTFIMVQYGVSELSVTNKEFIVSNTIEAAGEMKQIIESNYFNAEVLRYENFFVNIETINGKNVDDIGTNAAHDPSTALTVYDLDINNIQQIPMSLKCKIQCKEQHWGFIKSTTYTDSFVTGTQNGLIQYFENPNILFFIQTDEDDFTALSKYEQEEPEDTSALILSVIIVSIGVLISSLAFIYNKLSFTCVDNAAFFMPLLVSLNIYDFVSDVNLCTIIIATALMPEYRSYTSLMFWLAVMSVSFILVPFTSNLLYAMRIRRQRTVRNNPSARAYFGKHLAQFILFCVFCAGTYPVLGLTSSRLFALEIFNAGLLSSELHQLSKIKIRSTIYLENVPQLLIQILFTISTRKDGVKTATILAFVASSLSVVASLVIYQAQKDVSDEFIIEKYFIRLYNRLGINKSVVKTIKSRKGYKAKLGDALSQVFNISNKSIEIGFVTITNHGLIVHLQQQIHKEELDTLKNKLLLDQNIARGYRIEITSDMYIERLFDLHRIDILNALLQHFRVSDIKEFEASYHKSMQDANDYKNDNVASDVDDDRIFVAMKDKITGISNRNMFKIKEDDEKREMVEMAQRTAPKSENKDKFNRIYQRFESNMHDTNISIRNMRQQFLEMFAEFKTQQTVGINDDGGSAAHNAELIVSNDRRQSLLEVMSDSEED